jgi:hypothetical protein
MRIALNQYPKVNHSFIQREILALERQGLEAMRFALRGWDDELVDPEDRAERARKRYLLRADAVPILTAVARMLLGRPLRLTQAIGKTWRMSRRADRPLIVHLVYLAEACRLQLSLYAGAVAHLHAHFGTNSAEVTICWCMFWAARLKASQRMVQRSLTRRLNTEATKMAALFRRPIADEPRLSKITP